MAALINCKKVLTWKRLLVFAYIASALLVSGLSQAEQVPSVKAPVTYAQFNVLRAELLIQGYLPSPCQELPRVEVVAVDHESRQIKLAVASAMNSDFCIQIPGGNFDLTFDLRNIGLQSDTDYQLSVEDESLEPLTVRVPQSISATPRKTMRARGTLISTQAGFSLKTTNGIFVVQPGSISIDAYVGKKVTIEGRELRFNILPVVNEMSFNKFGNLPRSLVLTGISSSHE